MFKVKATVVDFDGDETKYPCHFRYRVGDTIIYDGEKFIGRICPSILRPFAEKVSILYSSGGRHREGEKPGSYLPFFHSPFSVYDPSYKIYDGIGFRPTLERPEQGYKFIPDVTKYDEPPGGSPLLGGPGSGIRRKETLVCGDRHTLMRMELEAIDLVDHGDGLPYTRRSMAILDKIAKKPGIAVKGIINEFTDQERDNIYPTLGQDLIWSLVGELAILDYVKLDGDRDSRVKITEQGTRKLTDFKKSLSPEERKALRM
ncbi:MAG: hypothetical protein ABIN58_11725 [candidate division WOR-3 bacterium]